MATLLDTLRRAARATVDALRADAPTAAPHPPHRPGPARLVLLVVVLALVFAFLLPRLVDYEAVLAALGGLGASELALVAGVTVLAYAANALPYWILVRGLSLPRAVAADLAGRAVASTVPGPSDIATRLVLYGQWGIPTHRAGAALVLGGLIESLSALVLPVLAVAVALGTGTALTAQGAWLAVIGVAVLGVAVGALVVLAGSDASARRIGGVLNAIAGAASRVRRRPPPEGIVELVRGGRRTLHGMLSRDGIEAFLAAVGAKVAWFLVLLIALRASGVDEDVVPPALALGAMGITSVVALIPLVPGAVGISEVTYVALFSSTLPPELVPPIAAGVLILRIAQWLVPIPLGWLLLVAMRRRRPLFADLTG